MAARRNLDLLYPLADGELNRLRRGYIARTAFHPSGPRARVMIIIGKNWREEDYVHFKSLGVTLVGVRLNDEIIDEIQRKNHFFTFRFGPLQVHLLREEIFNQLNMDIRMWMEDHMWMDRGMWILSYCRLGDWILDIGSAEGWMFRKTSLEPYVTSIDLNLYKFSNFLQMDAHHLGFSDQCFDVAVLSEVLEHVVDPVMVLKEAKRVAERLILTVPDEENWPPELYPYETVEESLKRQNLTWEQARALANPEALGFCTKDNYQHLFHNRHYTEESLKNDLKRAGIKNYNLDRLRYLGWSYFTVTTRANR